MHPKSKPTIMNLILYIITFSLLCASCSATENKTKANESGSFDFSIPIPGDVDTVLLGNNKKEIWQREQLEYHATEANLVAQNSINSSGTTISTRFNPPAGFSRAQANGFGEFLRSYPLLQDGSPVLLHDGSKKWNQNAHAAVFDMPLVCGDLQQCADSCIRLYAEYFYQTKQYGKIAFHLVNGFLVDFETWRKGGRVSVSGNKTEWVMNATPSDSQETFEKYLAFVFAYASTLSMEKESQKINVKDIRAGDFFIQGGSPGHVVMVLDVCQNERGEKAFLLGQGYMPAQQFHVLKNPAHDNDPWYYESELRFPLNTPEYTFGAGSLKRPVYDK